MTNIILCGGSGTRLWPISRTLMPKQFVKLFANKSLFQLTVERNSKVCKSQFIVSNAEQYFLALDQMGEIDCRVALAMTGKEIDCHATLAMTGKEIDCRALLAVTDSQSLRGTKQSTKYLLEPVGRNTAPAIALACMACGSDEIILVTPSDHLVKNEAEYQKVLAKAKELAEQDYLVTFGITPSFAETGFGYIEASGEEVKAFHEKPDFETAAKYVNAGNYYWNSGMFCFKAGVFLAELQKYSPEIFDACKIALQNADRERMIHIKHEDMLNIPDDSIDYAVMEKSEKVKVIPSDIGWSDVGSFDALYDELEKDENGNTQSDNLIAIDSKNNLIIGSERVIATIDVDDLIIVDSGDALLISKKGSSQKVKQVVQELKEQGSNLPNIHQTAHRPWGTYTILEDTPGYKIKRIEVKPGKRLSLQKHFHRNEHWIVVSGTATVTVGEEVKLIRPNESTYIKMGEVHRLANEGKIPVILIEAQVGEYTGEDDIIRVEDDFKRS